MESLDFIYIILTSRIVQSQTLHIISLGYTCENIHIICPPSTTLRGPNFQLPCELLSRMASSSAICVVVGVASHHRSLLLIPSRWLYPASIPHFLLPHILSYVTRKVGCVCCKPPLLPAIFAMLVAGKPAELWFEPPLCVTQKRVLFSFQNSALSSLCVAVFFRACVKQVLSRGIDFYLPPPRICKYLGDLDASSRT